MSAPYQTVVVPVDLGQASAFNRDIFPLLRQPGHLGRGDYYLEATLDEMIKIDKSGTNPQQWEELLRTTRARYTQLMQQKEEIAKRPKSWNPFKMYEDWRAARMFVAASKSLYVATKSRSEAMMRSMGVSVTREVERVDNAPPNAMLRGIAVKIDRPLDDTTERQIKEAIGTMISYQGPFQDDDSTPETSKLDDFVLIAEPLPSIANGAKENPNTTNLQSPTKVPKSNNNQHVLATSVNSNVRGATAQQEENPNTTNLQSPTKVPKSNNNQHVSASSVNSNVRGATAQQDRSGNSGSAKHANKTPK